MKNVCGCCEGLEKLTPMSTANRPGLETLIYRVGTHATFMESMLACLSSKTYPELTALTNRNKEDTSIALLDAWATVADVLTFYQERLANEAYIRTAVERRSILELARLVGYQLRPGVSSSVYLGFTLEKEAIADIPTGTQAQSIPGPDETSQTFETSETITAREEWNTLQPRLTRPQLITNAKDSPSHNANCISDIYLEGIDSNLKINDPLLFVFGSGQDEQVVRHVAEVEIQSDPRDRWERTRVRLQEIDTPKPVCSSEPLKGTDSESVQQIINKYLDAETFDVSVTSAMAKRIIKLAKRLQKSVTDESTDVDIITLLDEVLPKLREEYASAEEGHYGRLQPWISGLVKDLEFFEVEFRKTAQSSAGESLAIQLGDGDNETPLPPETVLNILNNQNLLTPLSKAPSIPPANAQRLSRDITQTFASKGDTAPRLLAALKPRLKPILYSAIQQTTVTTNSTEVKVYAMRTVAQLFGHNAPKKITYPSGIPIFGNWDAKETPKTLYLDNAYEKIKSGSNSYIVVNRPSPGGGPVPPPTNNNTKIFNNITVRFRSREEYGLSTKTTEITLSNGDSWCNSLDEKGQCRIEFDEIQATLVYAENELLTLSEQPILADDNKFPEFTLAPVKDNQIALAKVYDSLEAGRWTIVSGERYDAPGVMASELLMIASVEQTFDPELKGDKPHSLLKFAKDMRYEYQSDSVLIYGNVVKATHGETHAEILGSGDTTSRFQQFTISSTPLTYVAATTTSGVESSLQVRVNDALWKQAESMFGLGANDREYITDTNDDEETTVRFGDGTRGLRLPTGVENVTTDYRSGIGKDGNVTKQQISLLAKSPLGVKGVINPLPATGGAERDTREQARYNTPLAVMALDRLVSVQDYADFARIFAGIGKTNATRLTNGNRQVVYVTIAGIDDIPISESSDLYRSLLAALHKFGDPHQAIQLAMREIIMLIIHARVRISPEYEWETREPKIRNALLDHFSFEHRELGQDALLSEAISVIQGIPGVVYVDVDIFDGLIEIEPINDLIDNIEKLDTTLSSNEQPYSRVVAKLSRSNKEEVTKKIAAPIDLLSNDGQSEPDDSAKQFVTVLNPTQIAILDPEVADTLILTELT